MFACIHNRRRTALETLYIYFAILALVKFETKQHIIKNIKNIKTLH